MYDQIQSLAVLVNNSIKPIKVYIYQVIINLWDFKRLKQIERCIKGNTEMAIK